MPAQPVARVEGLDEFRRDLRKLDNGRRWTRELGAANREIAREIAPKAQARARGLGPQQRHFASAIKGYGSPKGASIGIAAAGKGQRNWGANAASWGVKDSISGWNRSGTPNLKVPWVGNTWDIAPGQGPRAIVDTVLAETPKIIERYGTAVDKVAFDVFDYRNRISTF